MNDWILYFKGIYDKPNKSDKPDKSFKKARFYTTVEDNNNDNDGEDREKEGWVYPKGVKKIIDRANREKARRLRAAGIEPNFEIIDDEEEENAEEDEVDYDITINKDKKE